MQYIGWTGMEASWMKSSETTYSEMHAQKLKPKTNMSKPKNLPFSKCTPKKELPDTDAVVHSSLHTQKPPQKMFNQAHVTW